MTEKNQKVKNPESRGRAVFRPTLLGAYLSSVHLFSGKQLQYFIVIKEASAQTAIARRRKKGIAGTIAATAGKGPAKRPEGSGLP